MKKIAHKVLLFVILVTLLGVGAQEIMAASSNYNKAQERLYCPLIQQGREPERSQQGCCSHHGGVLGCASNRRTVCRDCTYSPSCYCG